MFWFEDGRADTDRNQHEEPTMWEEVVADRRGRKPARVLRTDAPTGSTLSCERLTNRQVAFWERKISKRGGFVLELDLLRAECVRRGLSMGRDDEPGQLLIPFEETVS